VRVRRINDEVVVGEGEVGRRGLNFDVYLRPALTTRTGLLALAT
jgi:hypothetical protein